MRSDLILAFTVPIVSGLFSLAVALLAAHWERRKELIQLRINAYCGLESALSDWTDSKTVLTTAKVYDACNVIYIVGSERTRTEVQAVAAKVSTAGLLCSTDEFQEIRLQAIKAMQQDVQQGQANSRKLRRTRYS